MPAEAYLGAIIGDNSRGQRIRVNVYRSRDGYVLRGPDSAKPVHSSRSKVESLIREAQLVYGLRNCVFEDPAYSTSRR